MGFGSYIRQLREEKGFKLNEFAQKLEISPAYWSRIEREMEKAPKDDLIEKASALLGVTADQAFVEAKRLPPDMVEDLQKVVAMYRRKRS